MEGFVIQVRIQFIMKGLICLGFVQWRIKGGVDWATTRGPQSLSWKKLSYVNNAQYPVKETIANWN